MASAPNLLSVYQRISKRIETGTIQFNNISKLFMKRIEVYEKTARMLQDLLQLEIDKTDSLEVSIMDEINKESQMQEMMAKQLKDQILIPQKDVSNQLIKSRKELDKSLWKQMKTLKKVVDKCDQSLNALEQEKKAKTTNKNAKPEVIEQRIAKLNEEYRKNLNESEKVAANFQSTEMPTIHANFLKYDQTRMSSMQRYCIVYIDLKKKLVEAQGEAFNKMYSTYMAYDANDRSNRYVARCFDPKLAEKPENEETYVVAISDYRSEQPTDLTFQRGDKIKVLLQHSSGWWDGELNGVKGTFPMTYVMFPDKKDPNGDIVSAYFVIDNNFKPTVSLELELAAGDLVYVDYIKNGKCNGKNMRTGKRGNFPVSLLHIDNA